MPLIEHLTRDSRSEAQNMKYTILRCAAETTSESDSKISLRQRIKSILLNPHRIFFHLNYIFNFWYRHSIKV